MLIAENRAPADVLGKVGAEHRARRARQREDGGEVAGKPAALARRHVLADQCLRQRHQAAAAQPLHGPRDNQQRAASARTRSQAKRPKKWPARRAACACGRSGRPDVRTAARRSSPPAGTRRRPRRCRQSRPANSRSSAMRWRGSSGRRPRGTSRPSRRETRAGRPAGSSSPARERQRVRMSVRLPLPSLIDPWSKRAPAASPGGPREQSTAAARVAGTGDSSRASVGSSGSARRGTTALQAMLNSRRLTRHAARRTGPRHDGKRRAARRSPHSPPQLTLPARILRCPSSRSSSKLPPCSIVPRPCKKRCDGSTRRPPPARR